MRFVLVVLMTAVGAAAQVVPEIQAPRDRMVANVARQAMPRAARHAVAFSPDGGWAVGVGSGFVRIGGATRIVTSATLDGDAAAFLDGVGSARSLAFGADGAATVTAASGRTTGHLLTGRVGDLRTPRLDGVTGRRQATGRDDCNASYAALSDAVADLGAADADVVLHPTACEWMLVARGQATVADGAGESVWSELRPIVQSRLDAGERPVVALTPDGQGFVVVTPSTITRGIGVASAFEEVLRGDVGEVHAVAFDRQRWRVGAATGYVVVGSEGYVARGVERALCDAVETVSSNDGVCADAVGGVRARMAAGFDPNAPPVVMREGRLSGPLSLPRASSAPATPAGFFTENRDRVAVLIHGITPEPGQTPEANVGTIHHTLHYWGWDFISALLNRHDSYENGGMHLVRRDETGAGPEVNTTEITGRAWRDCTDLAPLVTNDFAEYDACQAQTPWPYSSSQRRRAAPGLAPILVDDARFERHMRGVMVTFREGAVPVADQVARAIDQIYDTYQHVYGWQPVSEQPQIALVAHSFGGIVARAILSLGDDDAFAYFADARPDLFTDQLRDRAGFIRDRTLHLTTMSTPHTGSPLIDMSQDIQSALIGYESALLPRGVESSIFNALKDFNAGSRAVLNDIREFAGSESQMNPRILHPAKARRADGSLVPVYTIAGRSPGGASFVVRKPFADLLQSRATILDLVMGGRRPKEAAGQFIFDRLLARMGYGPRYGPWGRADVPGAEPRGDLLNVPYPDRSSLMSLNGAGGRVGVRVGGVGIGANVRVNVVAEVIGEEIAVLSNQFTGYSWEPDGAYDSDGLVGFPSSHGLGMMGSNEPLDYFSHTRTDWSVPTGVVEGNTSAGSWYRLYDPVYGDLLPWDWDNHGSLTFNVGNGVYLGNVISRAGPTVGDGPWSTWDTYTPPAPPERTVSVTVTQLVAIGETRETEGWFGDGADWTLYVQIGEQTTRRSVGSGNVWNGSTVFRHTTRSSVVPVRISVVERDSPDPDDPVHLSPEVGREPLLFYVDTENSRSYGDIEASFDGVGFANTIKGTSDGDNRARIRFFVNVQ